MVRAAVAFLVLALVAFVFGAYGIAGASMEIARILLFVFLVLAVISFVGGMLMGGGNRKSLP